MRLVRYNPWQEIETLQSQLNRLFNDTLVPTTWRYFGSFPKVPLAELSETEEAIVLKLEVPGMEAKDLNVEVTEEAVSISGERQEENKDNTRSEFHYGKFHRVIPLPKMIQNTKVTAEYKDGVLNLTLPKREEEKNKVVKVNLEAA
ncbi:MAG: Hsp20/alpha crystallin family protein [Merismopedia sp. SIO2A8]|nr:Hsp20/alpha crystallin family protein [Symploca sp. SIO2B6]NET47341.1 Hsp20/alpha crystallin family protein [Merismopedia sp. SIO2A8]